MKTFFLKFTTTLLVLLYSLVFQANADELFNKGKEVFLGSGNCAACHMLSDAGSNSKNEVSDTKGVNNEKKETGQDKEVELATISNPLSK